MVEAKAPVREKVIATPLDSGQGTSGAPKTGTFTKIDDSKSTGDKTATGLISAS